MQEVTKLPMGKKSQKCNISQLNHVLNVWFVQNNLDNGPVQNNLDASKIVLDLQKDKAKACAYTYYIGM